MFMDLGEFFFYLPVNEILWTYVSRPASSGSDCNTKPRVTYSIRPISTGVVALANCW
jgi:hypothetical protein